MTAIQKRLLRLGLLVALIVGLLLLGKYSGLAAQLSVERVRAMVVAGGAWGVVLFVVLFSLGEVIHVPGLLFVGAGVLAYGRLWGGALSWVASIVAISITFLVARGVAGKPLTDVKNAWMRRMLGHLESRPVLTVFLLRTVFILSPPLSYALALSGMRYRDYLIGSAAGLALPVTGAVLFFDVLLRHFS